MRTRVHLALTALSIATVGSVALAADGPTVGGQLEVNYNYNFNKPNTRNNTFLFNNRDAEVNVNLGEINLKKAAADKSAGYTLRLITGRVQEYFEMTYKTGHLLEGYGTTMHEWNGKAVTVDFGQFLSHIGLETPDMGGTQFFSKSFNYQYLQPFIHAGVRASLAVDEKSSLMGVLVNRYDGVRDAGNRDLGAGFQFAHKSSDLVSWSINGLFARENVNTDAAPVNRDAGVLNLVYNNKISDTVTLAVDATARGGKDISNRSFNAMGIAGYLSKKLSNGNTVAVRGEYLSQNNASSAILPLYVTDPTRKPSMASITASYELVSNEGSRTLLEARWDHAGGAIFPGAGANTVKKEQASVGLTQVFRF